MSVGLSPILPMNQVQPNPEARFQRFGKNDSQLYGSPMVDLTAPKAQAPKTVLPHTATAQVAGQQSLSGNGVPETAKMAVSSEPSPTYSARAGSVSSGRGPQPSSHLDTQA